MNNIPSELDWVTERANCSPDSILRLLQSQAQSDMERRSKLLTATEMQYAISFSFNQGSRAFQVAAYQTNELLGCAIFEKVADGINVRYRSIELPSFTGILTLANDGQCRLKINDNEILEFWQFRRKALEPIFFDAVKEFRQ